MKEKKKEKNLLPQDRMLSIPNYYRKNANQNDNEKSDLTRLAILTSLQTIDAEESQEVRESHYRCGGNGR